MIIKVKVNTKSSKNIVIKTTDSVYDYAYKLNITTAPVDGKANESVIELLADYFKIPKNNVKIVRGFKSNLKTIEINV
jgi:hypothetical protein